MLNPLQKFKSLHWIQDENCSEKMSEICIPSNELNFSVEMFVFRNANFVSEILIYSHTVWEFTTEEETDIYLAAFNDTIEYVSRKFPNLVLYYIQNYEWFNPTKFIEHIKNKTKESPLKETLVLLPFENQRRICEEPPVVIQIAMPGVLFCKDVLVALGELWLL